MTTAPPTTPLPERLAHLLDRAERGALLPAEARQLRDIVTSVCQALADADADHDDLLTAGTAMRDAYDRLRRRHAPAATGPADRRTPEPANGPQTRAQGLDARAVLTVTITAPNTDHARHWAQTLRDLVHAEHGDAMRLHTTITTPGKDDGVRERIADALCDCAVPCHGVEPTCASWGATQAVMGEVEPELKRLREWLRDSETLRTGEADTTDTLRARVRTLEHVARSNKRHAHTAAQEAEALHRRAEQAEAALKRVRVLASQWAVLRTHGSAAYELRAALDGDDTR